MYVEKVDQVACEFLDKIKRIRNNETMEMPSNFGHELNCWALESIGVIALDQRLGVLENADDYHGRIIIDVKSNNIHFKRLFHSGIRTGCSAVILEIL